MVEISESDLINRELMEMLRKRQPSQQMNYCKGCYKPNQSITIKQHIGLVWDKSDILDENYAKYIQVKCKYCSEWRQLSLGRVSMGNFRMNKNNNSHFVLQKEHVCGRVNNPFQGGCCFNTLSGYNENLSTDSRDLKQLIKVSDKLIEMREKSFQIKKD